MNAEQHMAETLNGWFYRVDVDTGKISACLVPSDFTPDHIPRGWVSPLQEKHKYSNGVRFLWTDVQDNQLLSMRSEGVCFSSIGAKLGCSAKTVSHRFYKIQKEREIEIIPAPPPEIVQPDWREWMGIAESIKTPRRGVALLEMVSQVTNVTIPELCGDTRDPRHVRARHIFFYVARKQTELVYTEIAKLVRKLDHTTVRHGVNRVQYKRRLFEPEVTICMNLASVMMDAREQKPPA